MNINDAPRQNCSITDIKLSIPHQTLEERLAAFYGKPLDEIKPFSKKEVDWGEPAGIEAW